MAISVLLSLCSIRHLSFWAKAQNPTRSVLSLPVPDKNQDSGSKAIHLAPNTTSTIRSKSVSKDGGISNYRGLVKIAKHAENSRSSVVCDALILDDISESNTFPSIKNENNKVEISHEAKVGKIGDAEIFYRQSRGIPETEAERMIITGFVDPIIKALPFEYAIELNKLIDIEISGN